MSERRPIISVDFDGVLHSYTSGWKGARNIPDAPVDGAIEFLRRICDCPDAICCMAPPSLFRVCIFSSRARYWGGIRAMKKWLVKHGLERCYLTERIITFPKKKPPSMVLLDDRAIQFRGTFPTVDELNGFLPWRVKP